MMFREDIFKAGSEICHYDFNEVYKKDFERLEKYGRIFDDFVSMGIDIEVEEGEKIMYALLVRNYIDIRSNYWKEYLKEGYNYLISRIMRESEKMRLGYIDMMIDQKLYDYIKIIVDSWEYFLEELQNDSF